MRVISRKQFVSVSLLSYDKCVCPRVLVLCLQFAGAKEVFLQYLSKVCDSLLSGEGHCSLIHWLNMFTHPMCCVHSCSVKPHRKLALISQAWKGSEVELCPKNTGLLRAVRPHLSRASIDLRHHPSCFAWLLLDMVKWEALKLKLRDVDTQTDKS